MFFAAVALLASSALAATTTYTCSRNYTVVAGDTCDGISRSVSVSTYQLAMLNPAIDDACSNLDIGEALCLGLTDGSDCETTYTVAGGDTCDAVTAQFAINSTYLYMNNPQIDAACDNIYVGEVLCVGNKLYTLPQAFTINGGASAPQPVIGGGSGSAVTVSTSVSTAGASSAPAANAAAAPTANPGVTIVSVTTTSTSSAAPTTTSSASSSSSSSSSAAPTSSASADDDDDCDDDEDDS